MVIFFFQNFAFTQESWKDEVWREGRLAFPLEVSYEYETLYRPRLITLVIQHAAPPTPLSRTLSKPHHPPATELLNSSVSKAPLTSNAGLWMMSCVLTCETCVASWSIYRHQKRPPFPRWFKITARLVRFGPREARFTMNSCDIQSAPSLCPGRLSLSRNFICDIKCLNKDFK